MTGLQFDVTGVPSPKRRPPRSRPAPRSNATDAAAILDRRALRGLAGTVVEAIAPYTEAAEAALLIDFLVSVRARGKRKDGSIKWQARYWDPLDTTRRIEKVFTAKREAERWLTQQAAAIYDGTHIDPQRADRPFAALADEWRETWTDLEPKTRAGYESILNQHVIPRFGKTRVGAVTPEAIQRYVNELADKRASNTVRRIFSVVRGVLRVAVERRYIAVNPCDAVRLPRKGTMRSGGRKGRMLCSLRLPTFERLLL